MGIQKVKVRKLDHWLHVEFESSCCKTDQFMAFARQFRSELKKVLPCDCQLIGYNIGHFYISGFIYNRQTDKYAYFMTSDVRCFGNDWYYRLLVRTARSKRDFTGGSNHYIPFYEATDLLEKLTT